MTSTESGAVTFTFTPEWDEQDPPEHNEPEPALPLAFRVAGAILRRLPRGWHVTYGVVLHRSPDAHLCLFIVRDRHSALISSKHLRLR